MRFFKLILLVLALALMGTGGDSALEEHHDEDVINQELTELLGVTKERLLEELQDLRDEWTLPFWIPEEDHIVPDAATYGNVDVRSDDVLDAATYGNVDVGGVEVPVVVLAKIGLKIIKAVKLASGGLVAATAAATAAAAAAELGADGMVVDTTRNTNIVDTTRNTNIVDTTRNTNVVNTTRNTNIVDTTRNTNVVDTTRKTNVADTTRNTNVVDTTRNTNIVDTTRNTNVVDTTHNTNVVDTTSNSNVVGITRNTNVVHTTHDDSTIIATTSATAVAMFTDGPTGEIFFAQAYLPEGTRSATVVTGELRGLPTGPSYSLEVWRPTRDFCGSNVTGQADPVVTVLGVLRPDARGQTSFLLSSGHLRVAWGGVVVLRPLSSDDNRKPIACAKIVIG
ncbi:uncharacterized protein LOC108676512 isoform X1 [Hyalella azteca]|uniref:Uncharacterized protein LOC108676512 isoform X1 n=1 Tax=Hyalella azteca TaxID=294128 RepID=A0A8B7P4S9_HYAAZ|nr:uncharacterized protein LOC108676512 isoform X1 [Hyalella azteca]